MDVCRWGAQLSAGQFAVQRTPGGVPVPRSELTELTRSIHPPCGEGKEQRCDTRTHGQGREKSRPIAYFSVRRLFFSLVQNRVCSV